MKNLEHEEIQQYGIGALEFLCDICDKYNLTYFLTYGTLIGAVRHKGFIPWDDDIDVLMPRRDYEKLIKLSSEVNNEKYEIMSYKTNKQYFFPWIKIQDKRTYLVPSRFNNGFVYGISIDVFPLDQLCVDNMNDAIIELETLQKKYITGIKKIKPIAAVSGKLYRVKRIVCKIYWLLIGRVFWSLSDLYDSVDNQLIKNSENDNNKYVVNLYDTDGHIWEKDTFFGEKTYLQFENRFYRVPSNYDSVLKVVFNDYMELPPKEQRIANHHYTAYEK